MININTNADAVRRHFDNLAAKRLPEAARRTVNDIAFAVRDAAHNTMADTLDRPRENFTLRSVVVDKSPAREASAWVGLRKDGSYRRALSHIWSGGSRARTRIESAILIKAKLGLSYYAVPSRSVKTDRYGNMPLPLLRRIAAAPWTSTLAGRQLATAQTRKGSNSGALFFIPPNNRRGTQPGLYQRTSIGGDSSIKPLLVFVDRNQYRRMVDIESIGTEAMALKGQTLLAKNLSRALSSAVEGQA